MICEYISLLNQILSQKLLNLYHKISLQKYLDTTQNNIWRTLRANLPASYLSAVHAFSISLLIQFSTALRTLYRNKTFMTYEFSIIYSSCCGIKSNYYPFCLQNHISQCTRLHIFNGISMKMISYRKAALYFHLCYWLHGVNSMISTRCVNPSFNGTNLQEHYMFLSRVFT